MNAFFAFAFLIFTPPDMSRGDRIMAVSYIPEAQSTVTPDLINRGDARALEFYKKAFGAVEVMRMPGPDGESVMHAEIKIGDSHIYLADEFPGAPSCASPGKLGGTT